jgi:hypothetical protein
MAPSPRVRGEGWGEGAAPLPEHHNLAQPRRLIIIGALRLATPPPPPPPPPRPPPPHPPRSARRPLPARGERWTKRCRSRDAGHPRFGARTETSRPKKARGAERRQARSQEPRHALRRCRRNAVSGAARATADPVARTGPLRARSPLGAPPRLSSRGFRLHAIRSRPRVTRAGGPGVTRSSLAPKPSTWHPDPSVEGVDARTARERGYKPRPREPLPPHQSAVTGDTPHGRDGFHVSILETNVNRCSSTRRLPAHPRPTLYRPYPSPFAPSAHRHRHTNARTFSSCQFERQLIQATMVPLSASWARRLAHPLSSEVHSRSQYEFVQG